MATAAAKPTSKIEILSLVQSGELSIDDAAKLLSAASKPNQRLYCKVSEKGGCSVYGLQRMPVTLYVEQWERLLAFADDLKAFLAENNKTLKRKVV
jgi:hypothetical protein